MRVDRGQSETIGSILLVAITVIAVSVVAGAMFAANTPSEHPNARIHATADGANLSVEHRAGQPIREDDFDIVLRESGTTMPGPTGAPQLPPGDDDADFEPGETWVFDAGYPVAAGESVLLIYTKGDRVLLDEDVIGPTTTATTTESTTTPAGTTEPTTTATTTSTTTATTTTTAPNEPPVASFTIASAQGGNVDLDGTSSSDPDGTIVRYEWYEGTDTSGPPDATGPTVQKFNPKPSNQVTLVVTDDDGATGTATKSA